MENIVIDVADSKKQNGRVINYYHTHVHRPNAHIAATF